MEQSVIVMDDLKAKLLNEILDVMQKTKEGVLKGLEYTQSQIPDLIKQFLTWEFAVGIILLVFGIVLFLLGIKYWKQGYKRAVNTNVEDDAVPLLECICGVLFQLAGFIFVLANIMKVTQIWIAPKWFLIKWVLVNVQSLPNQ